MTSASSHYQAWSEISPGTYERRMMGIERFYVAEGLRSAKLGSTGGKEDIGLTSALQLASVGLSDKQSFVGHLRDTWAQLRWQQPSIVLTADLPRTVLCYQSVDAEGIQKWLNETFHVLEDLRSAEEDFGLLPAVHTSQLFYLPQSRQLVVRSPHWLIDGRGTVLLWDVFLTLLSQRPSESWRQLEWGREGDHLHVSLEEALGCVTPSEATEEQWATPKSLWDTCTRNMSSSIGIPSTVNTTPPGACAVEVLKFHESETRIIIQACREKRWTVTAAVVAANLLAQINLTPPEALGAIQSTKMTHYHCLVAHDLRPYLPQDLKGSDNAAGNWCMYWPFTVPLADPIQATTLASLAEWFTNYFTLFKYPENRNMVGLMSEYSSQPASWSGDSGNSTPREPMASSLGIIENFMKRQYGELIVQDLFIAEDIVAWACSLIFSTFNDRLRLVLSFNETQWKRQHIQQSLHEIKRILLKELA